MSVHGPQPSQSSQSIPSPQPIPPSKPRIQRPASQPDGLITQDGDSVVVQVKETVAEVEKVQGSAGNTQSSLEYASTQDESRVVVDADPPKSVDKPTDVVVVTEKADDGPPELPLP